MMIQGLLLATVPVVLLSTLIAPIASSSISNHYHHHQTHDHHLLSPWQSVINSLNSVESTSSNRLFSTQDASKLQRRTIESLPKRRKRHIYGSSLKQGTWRSLVENRDVEVEIDPIGDRILQTSNNDAAMIVCQTAIPLEEQVGQEFGTRCTCTPDTIQQTATLECKDMNCAYCNTAETVCTGYSYGVLFDKDGLDVQYFEEDRYTMGKSGAIRYTEMDEGCSISIGGTECSQCVMQECDDGYYGINAACTNIEKGATYNSCADQFSTSGIFEAYNVEEFGTCYGSAEICQLDAQRIVDNRYECYCDTDSTLKCTDKCEYCDEDFTVCGKEFFEQTIQNAFVSTKTRTMNYTSGRSETLVYDESNCDSSGCRNCTMKVNGIKCNSCTIQTCQDGTQAPQIECTNIDDSISDVIDFCVAAKKSLKGHVLQFMEPGFTTSCTSEAELACHEAKTKYEQHEHKFACACVDQTKSNSIELQCNATCGDLCNDEATVCVRESFYQDFLNKGSTSYFRKDIQYTLGRKETLSYVEYVDGTCSMTIDGVGCRSCQINVCQNNPDVERAPIIDCSDFAGGITLDLCQPNLRVETGIFERFSVDEFQGCMDKTPTNGVCETSVKISNLPHNSNGTTMLIPHDGSDSCGTVQSFAPGLWYSITGTGTGIEVSLCERKADFDVHVSVYAGRNCDTLNCVAASETNCKVHWLAENGTDYNIRVHGIGGQVGNFGLSIHEINLGSTECIVQKEIHEKNPNLTTTCVCKDPDEAGNVQLDCSVGCSTCETTGSVCANRTDSSIFDKGGRIVTINENYKFHMGRSEYLSIQKSNCLSHTECESCKVSINEESCSICTIANCADGSNGVSAVCGNATINTCEPPTKVDRSNVLHPLVDHSYAKCFSRDALVACEEHREFEQNSEGGIICECYQGGDSAEARLVCKRQFCLRCNQERTICGYDAFGAVFDSELGRLTGRFEGFQYVQGRLDLVAYHVSNDMSNPGDSCLLTLNDDSCDSCIITECSEDQADGQFNGISFDCQNVPGGLFYDGCSLIGLPGTFEFITSPAFEECVDIASPRETCEEIMLQTLTAESSFKTTCDCHVTETGGYELLCDGKEDCTFCDPSGSICAIYTEYLHEINNFGSSIAQMDTFQYISGRDEVLVIHDNKIECQVTVNGKACETCTYIDCDEEDERGYFIDCSSRVGENATFTCGEGHEIFTVISKSVEQKCTGNSTAPSTAPSNAPSSAKPSALPTRGPTLPPQQSIVSPPKQSGAHERSNCIIIWITCTLAGLWLVL